MFTDCKYTDIWKRWNGLSSVLSTAPMNISDTIVFPFLFLSIVFDTFVLFEKRKPSKRENLSIKKFRNREWFQLEVLMKFDEYFLKKENNIF